MKLFPGSSPGVPARNRPGAGDPRDGSVRIANPRSSGRPVEAVRSAESSRAPGAGGTVAAARTTGPVATARSARTGSKLTTATSISVFARAIGSGSVSTVATRSRHWTLTVFPVRSSSPLSVAPDGDSRSVDRTRASRRTAGVGLAKWEKFGGLRVDLATRGGAVRGGLHTAARRDSAVPAIRIRLSGAEPRHTIAALSNCRSFPGVDSDRAAPAAPLARSRSC